MGVTSGAGLRPLRSASLEAKTKSLLFSSLPEGNSSAFGKDPPRNPPFAPLFQRGVGGISAVGFPNDIAWLKLDFFQVETMASRDPPFLRGDRLSCPTI